MQQKNSLKDILNYKNITLKQWAGFWDLLKSHEQEFEKRFPCTLSKEELEEYFNGDMPKDPQKTWRAIELNDKAVLDGYPKYVEDIVLFWTGKESILEIGIDNTQLLGLYSAIMKQSLPEPKEIESFTLKGKTYKRMADEIGLDGGSFTMGASKLWQLVEGLTLHNAEINEYSKIASIISTFYWAEGETINEQEAVKRMDIFLELDIETALGCYFFLPTSFNGYIDRLSQYLKADQTQTSQKLTMKN